MHILFLFLWLSRTPIGLFMQRSQWAFAVVETVHLIALAVLGGSLLAITLRALGVMRRISSRSLARELLPVAICSFVAIVITGVLMVSEEALKCYYSPAFRAKMIVLAIAVSISLPLHLALAARHHEKLPWWLRVGAVASLLAWLSVGVAGRAIGFL